MTVLRSREIRSTNNHTTKTLENQIRTQTIPIEPVTPAKTRESTQCTPKHSLCVVGDSSMNRRRSLRIAGLKPSVEETAASVVPVGSRSRKRKGTESEGKSVSEDKLQGEVAKGKMKLNAVNAILVDDNVNGLLDGGITVFSLRSGKRVVKNGIRSEGKAFGVDKEILSVDDSKNVVVKKKEILVEEMSVDDPENVRVLRTRRGVKTEKGILDFGFQEESAIPFVDEHQKEGDNKGKRVLSDVLGDCAVVHEVIESHQSSNASGSGTGRRKYSRKEKGKEKLVVDDGDVLANGNEAADMDMVVEREVKIPVADNVAVDDSHVTENVAPEQQGRGTDRNRRLQQFHDIARRSASRFAHFLREDVEENEVPGGNVGAMPVVEEEVNREVEDWPGPFSTAMKIIRDRAEKLKSQPKSSTSVKKSSTPIVWIPTGRDNSKQAILSLQELCITILAKNADAISSLDHVPEVLKNKLSRALCYSSKMNSNFLDLLLRGMPSEIRLKDCSWLTEEQFVKSFETCDISNLMVLQLDNCGRCLADYILHTTLARATSCLPLLTALSISGACRLSDIGLNALVSSAPALKSINLSRCSLLTAGSIDTLANHLGSVLRELYLDDCEGINPMDILPALKKIENLEVLSLADMQMVRDVFVKELVVARGHNVKELVLADCVKLTDSSIKAIAETCPGLCALDLSNLCKLTDFSLGYLANGCPAMYSLKLCRNAFSDEAIAAYVEMAGESLTELSLNNVKKIDNNTALSLARRCKKLESLDLSWCRNVTDEAMGLIVDSCYSLKMLKLFGCSQITNVFLDGHSNPEVQIVGLKLSPLSEHLKVPDLQGLLHYS